jgi:4-hydroxybenzoate polyprenyltransferase
VPEIDTFVAMVIGSVSIALLLGLTRIPSTIQVWLSICMGLCFPMAYIVSGDPVPVSPAAFIGGPLIYWYFNRLVRHLRKWVAGNRTVGFEIGDDE